VLLTIDVGNTETVIGLFSLGPGDDPPAGGRPARPGAPPPAGRPPKWGGAPRAGRPPAAPARGG
jgi:hypothetical protein